MAKSIKMYLEDMLQAIYEIEMGVNRFGRQYDIFEKDVIFRRFVERNFEILGEAMNRTLKIQPDVKIMSARKIAEAGNYIIKEYDSIKPDFLWEIVINHIPMLKAEVSMLLESSQGESWDNGGAFSFFVSQLSVIFL